MTPLSNSTRRPLRALFALGLTLAAMAAWAGSAAAYVTLEQAAQAADLGAGWFQDNQQESGELGSDWGMTALAAAGINAADVSTSLIDPSAQDFYLGDWRLSGPGGAGADAERGILAGVAGGIQVSRLSSSADAERSNLVARLAELFDGTQIGEPGLLNDDIFGVLALHQAGAPTVLLQSLVDQLRTEQHADGGWSWNASPSAPSDTDMTGSVVAAFCAAGVTPSDPNLERALDLLHSLQDPATGGFIAPPESFGIGLNTDTTAWVLSGLIQCGIDPQGSEWTTSSGKTALDYLVSMQEPDGHFAWTEEFDGGVFETYSSVRPLGGVAFSSEPPARVDGTSPAVRPADPVPAGTTVPVTLVIDHGAGADDVRMCRVDVTTSAGLDQLLAAAKAGSRPGGCVTQFSLSSGAAGIGVSSLDGVGEAAGNGWRVQIGGAEPEAQTARPIGLGDLVFLRFGPTSADAGSPPKVAVPPLEAKRRHRAYGPRVSLRGRAHWRDDGIAVEVRCPRGLGAAGCRGVLSLRFREHRGGRLLAGGSTGFALASGTGRTLVVPANRALRRALATHGRVKLRLIAATRAEDGAIRLTRARRFIDG